MEDKAMNMEITKIYLAIVLIGILTLLWHKSYELTKDDELEEKINYIRKIIGYPKANFNLPIELKRLLLKRNFDPMSLRKLVRCIMEHLDLSMTGINVIIEYTDNNLYDSCNNQKNYKDSKVDENEILIVIKSYYSIEHIVALISYQCIYYYMNYKEIDIDNKFNGELILDVAAIYLGFGDFISKSHTPCEQVVEERKEIDKRIITKEVSIIGYLNDKQIDYVINRVSELKLLSIVKNKNLNKGSISKNNI
jgi:hypothetical protein